MEDNRIIEFKFNRSHNEYSIGCVKDKYQATIQKWLLEALNIKDKIEVKLTKLDCENLFEHTENYRIECNFTEGNRLNIFTFYIYGQNNCCGAMTSSMTFINEKYRNKKLGTILQYFKEDIALRKNIRLLTCTDAYSNKYNIDEDGDINDLKPYLPNTKLLLSTGWKVSELFYNYNSKNVVALYTKQLKSLTELEISMKISIKDEKVVEIKNVTVGADPELFLKSKDSGEFVPSFFVIKGDKNNPTPISDDGHNIQCDNVMVEYGIPPSKTAEEFVKHNMFVQNYLKDKVAEQNNLELVIFPYAEFDENNLVDERALAFG